MTPSSQDAFESLGPGCGHESPLGGVLRGAHHFSCAPAPMWLPRGTTPIDHDRTSRITRWARAHTYIFFLLFLSLDVCVYGSMAFNAN